MKSLIPRASARSFMPGRRLRLVPALPALVAVLVGTACGDTDRTPGAEPVDTVSNKLAVVTNGAFTNVYVFPSPSTDTWEHYIAALRPTDAASFSRASIDAVTDRMMASGWPSYFNTLYQYSGVNPPQFFGSAVASQQCVDAAMHDANNGVLEWTTIRSLANCHVDGMDPSPQVNLIFSPDIKVGQIGVTANGPDMCTTKGQPGAWHAWGVNVPNFAALPTAPGCATSFSAFTQNLSHEVVEMLSDPAGTGFGTLGENEVGDICQSRGDSATTTAAGDSLSRYWSVADNDCEPRLDAPSGSTSTTWVLGQASPLRRFTGGFQTFSLGVPADRVVTDAAATQVSIVIQTGGDDLQGGSNANNADVTLRFAGGGTLTTNVNQGHHWNNGETNSAILGMPSGVRVSDITGVTISTQFSNGDNWNVDKVALVVSYPSGSATGPRLPRHVSWLDVSSAPLVRFTGSVHDERLAATAADFGANVLDLQVVISTGNDDLRGGGNSGDNCDVGIELASGQVITVANANHGGTWGGWTKNTVSIPLPPGGLRGGDVAAVTLHTGFGGDVSGDNWNVERVQLLATLPPPPPVITALSPASGPWEGGTIVEIDGANFDPAPNATQVTFYGYPSPSVSCTNSQKCFARSPNFGTLSVAEAVPVQVTVGGETSGITSQSYFTYEPGPKCTSAFTCAGVGFGFPLLLVTCPEEVSFYDLAGTSSQVLVGTGTTYTYDTNDVGNGAMACANGACSYFSTIGPKDYCGPVPPPPPPPPTCDGLRKPVGKCAVGWRCCGSDGWRCGVCM